jgi:hypothetical protein
LRGGGGVGYLGLGGGQMDDGGRRERSCWRGGKAIDGGLLAVAAGLGLELRGKYICVCVHMKRSLFGIACFNASHFSSYHVLMYPQMKNALENLLEFILDQSDQKCQSHICLKSVYGLMEHPVNSL